MRRRVKKRVKLPSLARLKRKADHLWSTMVLVDGGSTDRPAPDGGFDCPCRVCHEKPAVSAHHIFHKGANGRFRYDRRNGLPICTGCHLRERYNPTPVVCAAMGYLGIPKFLGLAEDVNCTSALPVGPGPAERRDRCDGDDPVRGGAG